MKYLVDIFNQSMNYIQPEHTLQYHYDIYDQRRPYHEDIYNQNIQHCKDFYSHSMSYPQDMYQQSISYKGDIYDQSTDMENVKIFTQAGFFKLKLYSKVLTLRLYQNCN